MSTYISPQQEKLVLGMRKPVKNPKNLLSGSLKSPYSVLCIVRNTFINWKRNKWEVTS